jgi:putative tryptophan/tyrosine transport system substrate-binding protein
MCAALDYVEVGGLMAYAADPTAVFQRVADDVHQILNGTPPGEIPIIQPTKFEFLINLNTAKALNLTLSATLLAAADGVIE